MRRNRTKASHRRQALREREKARRREGPPAQNGRQLIDAQLRVPTIPRVAWALKRQLVGLAVISAAAAILLTYQISISPLSLRAKLLQFGAASTEVFIDSERSTLADAFIDQAQLSRRASILAEWLASPVGVDAIAQTMKVTPPKLSVTVQDEVTLPKSITNTQGPQRAYQLLQEQDQYAVLLRVDAATPIVQVYTQAQSGTSAIRLANAAVAVMTAATSRAATASGVPPARRIVLRSTGGARGGTVNPGAGAGAPVAIGVLIWCLTAAPLVMRRRRHLWQRLLQSSAQPPVKAIDSRQVREWTRV